MEDPKTKTLIEEVITKTKAGRMRWQPTATVDEYFSILPSGFTIVIGVDTDGYTPQHVFVLRNADDQPLLRVTAGVDGVERNLLIDLHESARRVALHVNVDVDKVLGELARL